MTRSSPRARPRTALAVAAACGLGALAFGLMTAGIGMPRLPDAGIRVTAPETVTVTDAEGRSITLSRAVGPNAWIEGEVARLDTIDTASRATAEVPVDPETAVRAPGEAPPAGRVVRGNGADAGGEPAQIYDPVVFYAQTDGEGVLPETVDAAGDRTAAQGTTGTTVLTDDPTVSRIYPAYNQGVRTATGATAQVPSWQLEFDLAAAHAEGRTNLPLPLGWYASPFAHGLDAAAPWLLGASLLLGAGAVVIARRARAGADADAPLRT